MAIKKINLRLGRSHQDPYLLNPEKRVSNFHKGHKYSTKEYIPPESHERKMKGLYKAWGIKDRVHRGERIVLKKEIKAKKHRAKTKLRETTIKEIRDIQEMCKTNAVAALQCIIDVVSSPEAKNTDKLAAANLILERAYGKSTQTNVNANIDANGKENEVTGKELDTRIATALSRVEAITGRAPKTVESVKRPPDVRERDRDTGGSSVH